jgi:hypothetical protein
MKKRLKAINKLWLLLDLRMLSMIIQLREFEEAAA